MAKKLKVGKFVKTLGNGVIPEGSIGFITDIDYSQPCPIVVQFPYSYFKENPIDKCFSFELDDLKIVKLK